MDSPRCKWRARAASISCTSDTVPPNPATARTAYHRHNDSSKRITTIKKGQESEEEMMGSPDLINKDNVSYTTQKARDYGWLAGWVNECHVNGTCTSSHTLYLRSAAAAASMANTSSRSNIHTDDLFVPACAEDGDNDDDDDEKVVVAAVCARASSSSKLPPIPAIAVRDWLNRVEVHRRQVLLMAAARERRVSIDSVDHDTPCSEISVR
jgi:hypothetical protein